MLTEQLAMFSSSSSFFKINGTWNRLWSESLFVPPLSLSLCLRLRLLASLEIPLLVFAYVLIKSKDNESENRALINVLLVN
jgi:hypothetical protein